MISFNNASKQTKLNIFYNFTYIHASVVSYIYIYSLPSISHWNGHSGTAVDVNHNKKCRMTATSTAPPMQCLVHWNLKKCAIPTFVIVLFFHFGSIVQCYSAGVFPTKQVLQEMHPIWRILQLWVHKPHLLIHSGSTQFAIQKF